MFTGIVQAVGRVSSSTPQGDGVPHRRRCRGCSTFGRRRVGDSVAVNGCCLTVVAKAPDALEFDVSAETLRCTTGLLVGAPVNLELALRVGDALGGHLMSGHVDGVGTVAAFAAVAGDAYGSWRLEVDAPDVAGAADRGKGLDRGGRRQPDGQRSRGAGALP